MTAAAKRNLANERHSLVRSASEISTALKPSRARSVPILRMIVSLVVLAASISCVWIITHRNSGANLNNVNTIMSLINKHYLLPSNETPALATVTDSDKVQSAFAGKVHNGDKILIYENNKKAIVYRPSIDRIVDVEPVTVSAPPSSSSSAPALPDAGQPGGTN